MLITNNIHSQQMLNNRKEMLSIYNQLLLNNLQVISQKYGRNL